MCINITAVKLIIFYQVVTFRSLFDVLTSYRCHVIKDCNNSGIPENPNYKLLGANITLCNDLPSTFDLINVKSASCVKFRFSP